MVALTLSLSAIVVALGAFVVRQRRLVGELGRYYEASSELLATVDLLGRFIRVNPAWGRALGHRVEAMCSCALIEFVHRDERAGVRAQMDAVAVGCGSSSGIELHSRFRTADGTYRWLAWELVALPGNGVLHVAARDVTEQRMSQQQLASSARSLEMQIAQRTHELDQARAETLQLLARVLECRDDGAVQHAERVGAITLEIATRLGLRTEQIRRLCDAAGLHDIGKIALPDRIVGAAANLSAAEQRTLETHAARGARLLAFSSSPVLQMAAVIAATHHERWDGSGYPSGLAGERIPLVGRVVAVADVFDTLTYGRASIPARPVGEALVAIRRAAGSHFDPRVVAAVLAVCEDTPATIDGADTHRVALGRHEALR